MDHCPAAKERKQEHGECEEQTPWLTEKPTAMTGLGGLDSRGLLCRSLWGGIVQDFSRCCHRGFLILFHFGRVAVFLGLVMHGPPFEPTPDSCGGFEVAREGGSPARPQSHLVCGREATTEPRQVLVLKHSSVLWWMLSSLTQRLAFCSSTVPNFIKQIVLISLWLRAHQQSLSLVSLPPSVSLPSPVSCPSLYFYIPVMTSFISILLCCFNEQCPICISLCQLTFRSENILTLCCSGTSRCFNTRLYPLTLFGLT